MSSGKEGKEKNEATAAKVAGAAVAVGIAWGIFRFVRAKKEEEALIQEYYGDREDFIVPNEDAYDAEEVSSEEHTELFKAEPPPPPPPPPEVVRSEAEELKYPTEEEIKASEKVEPPPEPKHEEKPWFLRLFDPPKKNNDKSKSKESDIFDSRGGNPRDGHTYEIKRGDTLWTISEKHGISLDALKSANGLHGDYIYAGDKLVIPPK